MLDPSVRLRPYQPRFDASCTLRVRRVSVPVEAIREDMRDAYMNERAVRAAVVGFWSAAAFVVGVILAFVI